MEERKYYFQDTGNMNKAWIGLLLMGIFIFLVFLLLKSLYKILWFASPVLILATLIIDRQVVFRFLRMVWRVLKRNWLTGLILAVLSALVFPFLSVGMLINAIINRKIRSKASQYGYTKQQKGFSEYEELDLSETGSAIPESEFEMLDNDAKSAGK